VENLGEYLSNLRQEKGIDYAQIWEDIRIPKEQICALEENRLFDLKNYGFAKALVYNYARYLGADIPEVLNEFYVMMPENTKKEYTPCRVVKERKIMLSTNFLWTISIIVFVGILGSILFHSYRQGWLNAPDFFNRERKVSADESSPREENVKPDSLRIRMRLLSESIPQNNTVQLSKEKHQPLADTTDYIGNILEESPVNIRIN
jgi:cytoskeletal protein RodZ